MEETEDERKQEEGEEDAEEEPPAPRPEAADPRDLALDPENPRLRESERGVPQDELLEIMLDRFRLEELANSIQASGFMPFDPIVVYTSEEGERRVAEGNRRIATLQLLLEPERAPEDERDKWRDYRESLEEKGKLEDLKDIQIQVVGERSRKDVSSYMGFRHVTGVMDWPPIEKAGFIALLIEEEGWSYGEIADRLGSYGRHMEKFYVAYRTAKQAEELEIPGAERLQDNFGFFKRALNSPGVRDYIGVDYPGDPEESFTPVPDEKHDSLGEFVEWAFGTDEHRAIVEDSRQLSKFGNILESEEAVAYLRRREEPDFQKAFRLSGGEADDVARLLSSAADDLEETVALVGTHDDDADVRAAVNECTRMYVQIIDHFPEILSEYWEELPDLAEDGG